jgi:hypothetical protein
MKPIDYTLYNQIKAKFPAQPNTILFVSITSDDVNELTAVPFNLNKSHDLDFLVSDHWNNLKPYAAIGGFGPRHFTFLYVSENFLQEEEYYTGEVLEFDLEPFRKSQINLEDVKQDLAKLSNLLFGNSKAS